MVQSQRQLSLTWICHKYSTSGWYAKTSAASAARGETAADFTKAITNARQNKCFTYTLVPAPHTVPQVDMKQSENRCFPFTSSS